MLIAQLSDTLLKHAVLCTLALGSVRTPSSAITHRVTGGRSDEQRVAAQRPGFRFSLTSCTHAVHQRRGNASVATYWLAWICERAASSARLPGLSIMEVGLEISRSDGS